MQVFKNHYILVIDLISTQDVGERVHYPELTGDSLWLVFFWDYPLESAIESVVLCEQKSMVKIDKIGTVIRN